MDSRPYISFYYFFGTERIQGSCNFFLPSFPAPAFSPASNSYVTSKNLSSFGNLEVDFVGFLNQNASFKANSTRIASVSPFSSSPLGGYSLQSTSSEVSIQEESYSEPPANRRKRSGFNLAFESGDSTYVRGGNGAGQKKGKTARAARQKSGR